MKTFVLALLFGSVASAQSSILISDDQIVVAGKPLSITLERFMLAETPELVEALVARRTEAPDDNPCAQIQAPGTARFALIRKVIFSCTTAGLTAIGLREKAARPVINVASVVGTPAQPTLDVTPTELRLTVAGAVSAPFTASALAQKLQLVRSRKAITVIVDDAVPFAAVLQILEACNKAGLTQLTLQGAGLFGLGSSEPAREAPVELMVTGPFDKEVIRKIVTANHAEVKACYEQVLTSFPKLDAKAVVKFVISAKGTVSSSVVESTTNAELGNCISDRVKTWVFPPPRGGGVVVVNYPFNFTPK